MILNPNKTKALVFSRSRSVNPSHGDLVLSGVSIFARLNFDILGVRFDSRLTFEDHVHGIVSRISLRISTLMLVKRVFVDTSMLLCFYYSFVHPIHEYWSPSSVGVYCRMSPSASRVPGVFGGRALPLSDYLVAVSSMSYCCIVYVLQG